MSTTFTSDGYAKIRTHDYESIKREATDALQNIDSLLREFYALPTFTPKERSQVWRLSMAGDALKHMIETLE